MPRNVTIKAPIGNQPTERQMFQTGYSFHEAALRCAEPVTDPKGSIVSPNSPMIVCYAMAAELYLKSLMVLDAGKAIPGHRLNVLFAKLRASTIASVEGRFSDLSGEAREELSRVLPPISAAFVEWRYIFEDKGERQVSVSALMFFVQALYAEIRARMPEWPVSDYLDQRFRAKPREAITNVVSAGGNFVRVIAEG